MTDKRADQWTAQDILEVFNDYDKLNEKGGEWSSQGVSFYVYCKDYEPILVEYSLYKEPVSELFDGVRELPENTVAEYSVVVFVGDDYNEVGLIYQTDDGQFILDDDYEKRWADLRNNYSIPELNDIAGRIQQEIKTEKRSKDTIEKE